MPTSKERNALLKAEADKYITSMEGRDAGINYTHVATDRLLILEALNDWSGRLLAEGGDIRLTYACDDPACATQYEQFELITRIHASPAMLYPVSGFSLSDKDSLRFSMESSTFRMTPHAGGSRSDAIGIAESTHIQDVDAAMNLWALCATEDCLAYLNYQMREHGLYFDDEELSATRQIITSALLTTFSVGQVWNAIWRSVRDAAALSARPYYNVAKAAKTIPKKIDKVLTQHAGDRGGFADYDRLASLPMGAVLTLLLNRFGIEDDSRGPEDRAKFTDDAALAPKRPTPDVEPDEGRAIVRGTLFFLGDINSQDRMLLSCFDNLQTDTQEPEWDESHTIGRLVFTLSDLYAFDGHAFLRKYLAAHGVPEPTPDDISRHAAAAVARKAIGSEREDVSGHRGAMEEALIKTGINPDAVPHIYSLLRYPLAPEDVLRMLDCLPDEWGLAAVRSDFAHVYSDCFEGSNGFYTSGFSLLFPEERLEPAGCDTDLLMALAKGDFDKLAELVASTILLSVDIANGDLKRQVLQRVSQRLLAHADPSSAHEGQAG